MIVQAIRNVHERGTVEAQSVRPHDAKIGVVRGDDGIFRGGGLEFLTVPDPTGNDGVGEYGTAGRGRGGGRKIESRLPIRLKRRDLWRREGSLGCAGANVVDREKCNEQDSGDKEN